MQPQVLTYFQPSAEVHSISDLIALRTDPPTDTDTDPPTDTELFTFIYLIHFVCGGWMFMCQCICVEMRGQFDGVSFLLRPCGFRG